MKILSNEALELSYDATEEIEEISKEGDELEDELDVAGDIVIEAEEGEATASKLLANPIVEPGSAEEGNLIKITRLTNESLIRVTEKLNLPGYTYTASFEAFVDPYTSLEVSREGFREIVTKMIEKVKEIWIKIKEVFKKLFRASMRKLQTSVTKLENLIKDLPQSEETYKLSEKADESSFNKALKIADNCPPRTDNASKVMGAKLAETIKALIPDLDGQTSATNKWASEITAYSTTVKNAAKTDANGQSTGPDASKLEAVIKTAIDFTKYEAKYWKNSDLAANGATHLVVGHPDAGVFINKDKPEFKKTKMEANDAEHTKYVNALKNASTTVNELKDLLSFLKEIPNKQEVLNKAIDQAIAKIDRELLTGLDSLKNVKSTPNASTANTNSQANNGAANADKTETKASNSNIGTYKGLMMLVPVVLNGSYKQLGDAVNGGIAIVSNIKAQISGGAKEEEKTEEGGNNKETSQSNESLDLTISSEALHTENLKVLKNEPNELFDIKITGSETDDKLAKKIASVYFPNIGWSQTGTINLGKWNKEIDSSLRDIYSGFEDLLKSARKEFKSEIPDANKMETGIRLSTNIDYYYNKKDLPGVVTLQVSYNEVLRSDELYRKWFSKFEHARFDEIDHDKLKKIDSGKYKVFKENLAGLSFMLGTHVSVLALLLAWFKFETSMNGKYSIDNFARPKL